MAAELQNSGLNMPSDFYKDSRQIRCQNLGDVEIWKLEAHTTAAALPDSPSLHPSVA